MALDSEGNIFVAGVEATDEEDAELSGIDLIVAKYSSEGILDTTFGTDGIFTYDSGVGDVPHKVILDAEGRLLIVGYLNDADDESDEIESTEYMFVVRLTATGSLDTTFGGGDGIFTVSDPSEGEDIALDTSGRIFITGEMQLPSAANDQMALWRLTSDGALDTTFDADGSLVFATDDTTGIGMAIDSDGQIVISGYNGSDIVLWRYR